MGRRVKASAAKPSKPPVAPVVVVRPGIDVLHPAIRRTALELARWDVKRIEVVTPTKAIVR